MTLRFNRRHFSAAAIATPAALALSKTQAFQATPESSPVGTEMVVGLTSTLEEWTAAAGEGQPLGDNEQIFVFTSPIDGTTPVTVWFTDEMASFMEYNYGEEGPGQEDAHAIVAASIPTESMPGEQFLMPSQEQESSPFNAQVYTMPSAPNSAILSVMALGAIEAEEARVVSISLSLPAMDSGYTATGDPGGIGLTRGEWMSIYGEPSEQGAEVEIYAGVGPDGMDIATRSNVELGFLESMHVFSAADSPVVAAPENAIAFIGSSVPEDSVVGQYFALPATEDGPIALDAVLWTSPALQEEFSYKGSVLSMMYHGPAGVIRIDLTMNSDI